MENNPFKKGGIRITHRAGEIVGDEKVAGIAKVFKKKEYSTEACFNEDMSQVVSVLRRDLLSLCSRHISSPFSFSEELSRQRRALGLLVWNRGRC